MDNKVTQETWSLDTVRPTKWMRRLARIAGVTGDDAAVVAWHARVSRAVADVRSEGDDVTARCPVCDRVTATDEDHERIAPGEGEHLCWREWSPSQCESARVDWHARHEALTRACRALAGLDSSGLDVSHEAQRAVLRAHGWTHAHDLPWWGNCAVTSHEEWTHASLPPVRVCVLPDAEAARDQVRRWARDVASSLGRVSQAEVLAEAIGWQARQ